MDSFIENYIFNEYLSTIIIALVAISSGIFVALSKEPEDDCCLDNTQKEQRKSKKPRLKGGALNSSPIGGYKLPPKKGK
jgi:hypothetical protein